MASTLGQQNPFRYRSYVYDTETGLYYLQSRYYNPQIGRFINADSLVSTGQGILGYNMFAYCNNNPVNSIDLSGNEPVTITVTVVFVATVCVFTIALVDLGAHALSEFLNWISSRWYFNFSRISYAVEETPQETPQETLPRQGQVSSDENAPSVDAGKQGKHVPGHNNYDSSKSSWPEGQTGVPQTQEAWQNGVEDPKVPGGSGRIGISADGTVVRVHMDGKGLIHGYPLYPTWLP